MQPLQICIGPIIRIGRESWCLPYAGFFICIRQSPKVELEEMKKNIYALPLSTFLASLY